MILKLLDVPYRSGVPCLKDMAVELDVGTSWVVGDEGKLGIGRTGGGQRDPAQGVSHEEGLQTSTGTQDRITRE